MSHYKASPSSSSSSSSSFLSLSKLAYYWDELEVWKMILCVDWKKKIATVYTITEAKRTNNDIAKMVATVDIMTGYIGVVLQNQQREESIEEELKEYKNLIK